MRELQQYLEANQFFSYIVSGGGRDVVRIWSRTGARPILAAGNSNADIQMLKFATQGSGASLALLVTHDDDKRDIPYTSGAQKAVALAREHGWSLVSVHDDWAKVFVD